MSTTQRFPTGMPCKFKCEHSPTRFEWRDRASDAGFRDQNRPTEGGGLFL
jgi:hypothetical protein